MRVVGIKTGQCRDEGSTDGQYLRHLAEDVLPGILERALTINDTR